VDSSGIFNLAQTTTAIYSTNNTRCAITDGTNNFWTAGGNNGTFYLQPPQSPAIVQNTIVNTRYVKIINGNLYFSSQSGAGGIYTFQGGGLPRNPAITNLVFATGANSQPAGFEINPALTVAYVADQRHTAGGIQKWTNSGSIWSLAYTIPTGAGAFGLAVDFSGAAPIIYATTDGASSNSLVRVVDTNSSATASLLAVAGADRTFRGVDFTPQSIVPVLLGIQQDTTNVVLSWPTYATGYALEANSRVDSSNDWTTVSQPVVIINNFNTVTIPATNDTRFYRLKH
jgi:hypothetical protein